MSANRPPKYSKEFIACIGKAIGVGIDTSGAVLQGVKEAVTKGVKDGVEMSRNAVKDGCARVLGMPLVALLVAERKFIPNNNKPKSYSDDYAQHLRRHNNSS